mgnify:CR=1 FL=1
MQDFNTFKKQNISFGFSRHVLIDYLLTEQKLSRVTREKLQVKTSLLLSSALAGIISFLLTCLYVPSNNVSRLASGAGVLSLNLVNNLLCIARNCWARCDKNSQHLTRLRRCYE